APACVVSQGIDLETQSGDAEPREECMEHCQDLDIDVGMIGPEGLYADLVELAVPPLLRPLMPEHGPQVIELDELAVSIQFVFNEGPHDPRGPFRPERDLPA